MWTFRGLGTAFIGAAAQIHINPQAVGKSQSPP
jgi:hypothetical protein